jgi:hypothetical protein
MIVRAAIVVVVGGALAAVVYLALAIFGYFQPAQESNLRVGITIIVALALGSLVISIIVLCFVIASELRRIARKELTNIMRSNLVHNPMVAEKLLSDVLFHCVQEKRLDLVSQINITDYVINHYVDFRFNYRVYNNLLNHSRESKSISDLREVAKLAQAIEGWRSQADAVSKQMYEQVNFYFSLSKKMKVKLAMRYINRRQSHFLAAVQKFVSDTKEVAVSALSNDVL